MEDRKPVYISADLYRRAEEFVEEQGGFSSVDELVEFILGELLSSEEGSHAMSEEDEEKVKERLRALGYL